MFFSLCFCINFLFFIFSNSDPLVTSEDVTKRNFKAKTPETEDCTLYTLCNFDFILVLFCQSSSLGYQFKEYYVKNLYFYIYQIF